MEQNELYPVEEFFMTKNRCYKANKRRTPTGIQIHSVGCKGTNRDRWRRWNDSAYKKCPNAFIDTNGIMQCLDWDVRPWLSGSGKNGNANNWCVGFEICEPSSKNDTAVAAAYLYGCVRWLCIQLCKEYGINPAEIKCHSELHKEGFASNHADVNHWWGKKRTAWEQYTMARLRLEVAEALKKEAGDTESLALPMETYPMLKKGDNNMNVAKVQSTLTQLGYDCGGVDGQFGNKTLAAIKKFQRDAALKKDGIVGPQTWKALNEAFSTEGVG